MDSEKIDRIVKAMQYGGFGFMSKDTCENLVRLILNQLEQYSTEEK